MGFAHFLPAAFYFLLILSVMVLVHEFGHFIVARMCGVRVEAFALGFGKRLFGYVAKNGTDYRVNLLPFGGYVKMTGELDAGGVVDVETSEPRPSDPGDFNSKPRWQRCLVALAGPVANFILAFVILTLAGIFHHEVAEGLTGPAVVDYVEQGSVAAKTGLAPGDTIVQFDKTDNPTWMDVMSRSAVNPNTTVPMSFTHNGQRVDTTLFIASDDPKTLGSLNLGIVPRMQTASVGVMQVLPETPASRAGLQAADQILSIDGYQLHSVDALLTYLSDMKGKPSVLQVLRKGATVELPITPDKGDVGNGTVTYRLGFAPVRVPMKSDRLSLPDAMKYSFEENKRTSMLIGDVIGGLFARRISVRTVSGPVGIFQQVDTASQLGFWVVIGLAAGISLNLGIFNLLPFPLLDGGMILFLAIEGLMRRDLNVQVKERIYQGAFVMLLVFAALVIFNDFSKMSLFHH